MNAAPPAYDEAWWSGPANMVTLNFSVREACWLPTWGRLHLPTDAEALELQLTCNMLEEVRTLLGGKPMNVHCMIRPAAYNAQIGGAPNSAHIVGQAVDFDVQGLTCDQVRAALEPHLQALGVRCERRPGSNWVHLDRRNPGVGMRYFVP